MTLARIGFDIELERSLRALGSGNALAGRVARVDADVAHLLVESGELVARIPRRVLRADLGRPVTGDWVAVSGASDPLIEAVLPRRTKLVRKAPGKRDAPQLLCANVDVLFVVMGLDRDFNLRRLERYLTLAAEGGMHAVVLLTKAGLVPNHRELEQRAKAVAPGVDVHAIDVVDGIRASVPADYVTGGVTAAVVGSSGAGKSTLVNHLLGEPRMKTGTLRAHDARGKHTTTHRELLPLPSGGAVIDTPGLRELGLWADSGSLEAAFPDVTELAAACRYRDCAHRGEPGCAVQGAVQAGTLDGARLLSYIALGEELERRARGPRRG